MEVEKNIICPLCGGDGKETCSNPDHGFIDAMSFHDIGRLGCPVCGHDPKHKVKNGGACEVCNGEGIINRCQFDDFVKEYKYDGESEYLTLNK